MSAFVFFFPFVRSDFDGKSAPDMLRLANEMREQLGIADGTCRMKPAIRTGYSRTAFQV
jgi:hypothetical protein